MRRALRAGDYDAVLDLQGAIRSAVVGRMAGCRRLIGEAEPRERAARWLFTERVATHGAHVIEQDVELASAVAGDDLKFTKPWLPVDPAAEAWADEFCVPRGRPARRAYQSRRGLGRQALAGGALCRGRAGAYRSGLARAGQCRSRRRAAGGGHRCNRLARLQCINCSLDQLIALTRRIALVIAGDTGPLHLACALGRPVVGIYGPTDPSRNGPFGTQFKVLRSPESRRDHTRLRAPEAGLLTIQPEDVLRGRRRAAGRGERLVTSHNTPPKTRPTQRDWITRWQRVARRIRVPLGFLTAALYLFRALAARAPAGRRGLEPGAGAARASGCAPTPPAM